MPNISSAPERDYIRSTCFFVYMHTYICIDIVYIYIYDCIIYYVCCIYIINICIIHIWIFRPPFIFGCCSCCTLLLGVDHKKYSSLPTRLFLIVFGRTGINKHQFVDFVILWSGMSVCFNNSLIDCCVGFGLRRFVSTWQGAANPEFKRESANNFAFKTSTKTFKMLAKPIKRLQIRKSGSEWVKYRNMLFLILPWLWPVVNEPFLNLDWQFKSWTIDAVKARLRTVWVQGQNVWGRCVWKGQAGNGSGEGPVGMSERGCADVCGRRRKGTDGNGWEKGVRIRMKMGRGEGSMGMSERWCADVRCRATEQMEMGAMEKGLVWMQENGQKWVRRRGGLNLKRVGAALLKGSLCN